MLDSMNTYGYLQVTDEPGIHPTTGLHPLNLQYLKDFNHEF